MANSFSGDFLAAAADPWVAERRPGAAARYSKSWSSAMPWLNSAWAVVAPELDSQGPTLIVAELLVWLCANTFIVAVPADALFGNLKITCMKLKPGTARTSSAAKS